jgi:hypothetical protein
MAVPVILAEPDRCKKIEEQLRPIIREWIDNAKVTRQNGGIVAYKIEKIVRSPFHLLEHLLNSKKHKGDIILSILTNRPGFMTGRKGSFFWYYTEIIEREIPEICDVQIVEIKNVVNGYH